MESKNDALDKLNKTMSCINARIFEEQEKYRVIGMMASQGDADKTTLKFAEIWINAFLANGFTVKQAMNVLNTWKRLTDQAKEEERKKNP